MATLARFVRSGETVVAPELLFVECANVLVAGVRRRRWSGAAADRSYSNLLRLPLRTVPDRRYLDRAWELSRRFDNHPVYDMLYAATAEAANHQFFTSDETLLARLAHLGWVLRPTS
jgi:predicted nucleic acid-binding protein